MHAFWQVCLVSHLTEVLEKIHFIKAAGIEESQINVYKNLLKEVTEKEFKSTQNEIYPRIVGSNISQLTLFLILIGGGYLFSAGEITFGQITACAMLGGRCVSPVVGLMNYYQQTIIEVMEMMKMEWTKITQLT